MGLIGIVPPRIILNELHCRRTGSLRNIGSDNVPDGPGEVHVWSNAHNMVAPT